MGQLTLRSIPGIGSNLATYREELFVRQKRRAEALGQAASELLDPEELFQRIRADDRLADMFQAAVDAAVSSSSEAKIQLLGRALATGALADDEAGIDEAQELIRVVIQLEAVDLRAMLTLRHDNQLVAVHQTGYTGRDPVKYLQNKLGMTATVAATVVARLRQLGLLEEESSAWINDVKDSDDDSVNVDREVHLSPAGRELLSVLQARGTMGNTGRTEPAEST